MASIGRRQLLAVLLGLAAAPVRARERWSLIPTSDAIICARMKRMWRLPWFDGWHMWGTLHVERVLKGNLREGTEISYRFLCTNCDAISLLRGAPMASKTGLWYLKNDGNGKWTSAGGGDDLGLRMTWELPGLIEVLNQTAKEQR